MYFSCICFYHLSLAFALDVKGWLRLVTVILPRILCKYFELYALSNDCFLNIAIATYAMKLSLPRQFRGEDIPIMFTFMLVKIASFLAPLSL